MEASLRCRHPRWPRVRAVRGPCLGAVAGRLASSVRAPRGCLNPQRRIVMVMDADVDDGMEIENPHVLLEMTDKPDCRFVADWLVKAAEAQTAWSKAFDDPLFKERTDPLNADGIPDLAASA